MSRILTHGGLFEGYGGTTQAARLALGGELRTRWVSDIKPASITLLQHHHPSVPNFGDLTRAFPAIGPITREAAELRQIDVLTASWPCQPHSAAGKRLGEKDSRALWPNVVRVIAELRPAIFLGENVARIASNGELRRVVRALADLGYVGAWRCVRASDVRAPHRRDRGFVVAIDPAAYAAGLGWGPRRAEHARELGGSDAAEPGGAVAGAVHGGAALTLLPTPIAGDSRGRWDGGGTAGRPLCEVVHLLPTPTQRLGNGGMPSPEVAARRPSEGIGQNLDDAVALLKTPTAQLAVNGGSQHPDKRKAGGHGPTLADEVEWYVDTEQWGAYAAAIARWAAVLGWTAPPATVPSPRAGKRPVLNPAFVEWMMGLPQGWVTEVPGLTRAQMLSLLGDGVVPQQAAHAFRFLLDHLAERLAYSSLEEAA